MTIQHVYDEGGRETAVIVPIDLWKAVIAKIEELEPAREGASCPLDDPAVRERLLSDLKRRKRLTWDEVLQDLDL